MGKGWKGSDTFLKEKEKKKLCEITILLKLLGGSTRTHNVNWSLTFFMYAAFIQRCTHIHTSKWKGNESNCTVLKSSRPNCQQFKITNTSMDMQRLQQLLINHSLRNLAQQWSNKRPTLKFRHSLQFISFHKQWFVCVCITQPFTASSWQY